MIIKTKVGPLYAIGLLSLTVHAIEASAIPAPRIRIAPVIVQLPDLNRQIASNQLRMSIQYAETTWRLQKVVDIPPILKPILIPMEVKSVRSLDIKNDDVPLLSPGKKREWREFQRQVRKTAEQTLDMIVMDIERRIEKLAPFKWDSEETKRRKRAAIEREEKKLWELLPKAQSEVADNNRIKIEDGDIIWVTGPIFRQLNNMATYGLGFD